MEEIHLWGAFCFRKIAEQWEENPWCESNCGENTTLCLFAKPHVWNSEHSQKYSQKRGGSHCLGMAKVLKTLLSSGPPCWGSKRHLMGHQYKGGTQGRKQMEVPALREPLILTMDSDRANHSSCQPFQQRSGKILGTFWNWNILKTSTRSAPNCPTPDTIAPVAPISQTRTGGLVASKTVLQWSDHTHEQPTT